MEEIAGRGIALANTISERHGFVPFLLVVVLVAMFVMMGLLGWFVGGSMSRAIEANSQAQGTNAAAVTAMTRVVDRFAIACQAARGGAPMPQPQAPQQPPQWWLQQQQQQQQFSPYPQSNRGQANEGDDGR